MKFAKSLMPDAAMKRELADAVREIVGQGCHELAFKHQCMPISSIMMISDYCMHAACDLHREHAIEYFRAALEEKTASCSGTEKAARNRRLAAFDKLAADAQMFDTKTEGRA
jgi:hypothetical protein